MLTHPPRLHSTVIEGEAVLARIAELPCVNERPTPPCVVLACGILTNHHE